MMRAALPYCLQCRSASACTSGACAANHLRTRALALSGGGEEPAHPDSSVTASKIDVLRSVIALMPLAESRGNGAPLLATQSISGLQRRDCLHLRSTAGRLQALGARPRSRRGECRTCRQILAIPHRKPVQWHLRRLAQMAHGLSLGGLTADGRASSLFRLEPRSRERIANELGTVNGGPNTHLLVSVDQFGFSPRLSLEFPRSCVLPH